MELVRATIFFVGQNEDDATWNMLTKQRTEALKDSSAIYLI